jgi:hypothetical protein
MTTDRKRSVIIRTETGEEAAAVYAIKRVGDKLIMDGKALGTMHMEMILSTEDALQAIKMALSPSVIAFVALLPFYAVRNRLKKKKRDEALEDPF